MKKNFLLALFLIVFINNISAITRRYRLMFNTNPSTEITIGWEQVSGTNPVVYFGTIDQGTNYSLYTSNITPYRQVNYFGMNNRFAKLTGLLPNTNYYFVIVDSEGTSQRFWFKTCPNVNTETISLISGGDSRSGTTQRINSNKMVAKIRPHAVIFGGDLMDVPSNSSIQQWLDDWQFTTTTDNQMIPVVHSFGNHEQYGTGGANFMYDLFDVTYDVYFNLKFGGDLFSLYTLNGEVLPSHTIPNNTVRVAQRNWLQTSLQSDNSIWKSAQYHRPIAPHEAAKGEGADEFNDWANTFYNNGVRLVLESDAHVVKLTREVKPAMTTASGNVNTWFTTSGIDPGKGITFIGEGSWGTIRTMDDAKPWTQAGGSFYQFSWLLIDRCKIEIRTIDTQNPNSIPEHLPGDYTSISAALENQIWKPSTLPSGVRRIVKCNPPDANFTANQTTINTNSTVNFTDLSTNTPTSWLWNFGDGTTSTLQNPNHTYTVPGTYTVTLTVSNSDGPDTETKINYIQVINPSAPIAEFIANNVNPSINQTINFTDLSTFIPTSWFWDFGDGTNSTLQNPIKSYLNPGTYTVTLTATNAQGTDSETKVGYIVIQTGGQINVTISNGNDDAEEFNSDGAVYLTSSDLELGNDLGAQQKVGLRFQNISIPNGAIITNAYIQFRADEDDAASTQLNIYIAGEKVPNSTTFNSSNFNISNRVLTTNQYTWASGTIPGWTTNTLYNTPNINSIIQEIVNQPLWTIGNALSLILSSDANETDERVADSYEGGYPARLIIDYTLPSPPVSNFIASTSNTCLGNSIQFTNSSTGANINSYLWNFGDGTFSTSINPSHSYTLPGNYSVSLTATNTGGSTTYTYSNQISVNANPIITFNGITEICYGQSTIIQVNGANTYTWSNGLATGSSNSISPTSTTSYTVFASDLNGCNETESFTITVNPLPSVMANASQNSICAGSSVTLFGGGANSYIWDNGVSNATVFSPNSSQTFTVTGTDNNGCSNSTSTTITVNPLPSVTANASQNTICQGSSVTLFGGGANSYTWNNGISDATAFSPNTSQTYTVTGTDNNGCSNSTSASITVNPLPSVTANASQNTICQGSSVTLFGGGANSYTWDNGISDAAAFSPNSSQTFTVTGTDNNGCSNSASTTITVNPLPNINITASEDSICNGQSISLNADGAETFTWIPSAVGNSIIVNPSITTTYIVNGEDINGCENTSQIDIFVSECLSIIENNNYSIKIYPNPFNHFVYISNDKILKDIILFDSNGKEVKRYNLKTDFIKLDLSNLENGMYYIQLNTDENSTIHKIIKE